MELRQCLHHYWSRECWQSRKACSSSFSVATHEAINTEQVQAKHTVDMTSKTSLFYLVGSKRRANKKSRFSNTLNQRAPHGPREALCLLFYIMSAPFGRWEELTEEVVYDGHIWTLRQLGHPTHFFVPVFEEYESPSPSPPNGEPPNCFCGRCSLRRQFGLVTENPDTIDILLQLMQVFTSTRPAGPLVFSFFYFGALFFFPHLRFFFIRHWQIMQIQNHFVLLVTKMLILFGLVQSRMVRPRPLEFSPCNSFLSIR